MLLLIAPLAPQRPGQGACLGGAQGGAEGAAAALGAAQGARQGRHAVRVRRRHRGRDRDGEGAPQPGLGAALTRAARRAALLVAVAPVRGGRRRRRAAGRRGRGVHQRAARRRVQVVDVLQRRLQLPVEVGGGRVVLGAGLLADHLRQLAHQRVVADPLLLGRLPLPGLGAAAATLRAVHGGAVRAGAAGRALRDGGRRRVRLVRLVRPGGRRRPGPRGAGRGGRGRRGAGPRVALVAVALALLELLLLPHLLLVLALAHQLLVLLLPVELLAAAGAGARDGRGRRVRRRPPVGDGGPDRLRVRHRVRVAVAARRRPARRRPALGGGHGGGGRVPTLVGVAVAVQLLVPRRAAVPPVPGAASAVVAVHVEHPRARVLLVAALGGGPHPRQDDVLAVGAVVVVVAAVVVAVVAVVVAVALGGAAPHEALARRVLQRAERELRVQEGDDHGHGRGGAGAQPRIEEEIPLLLGRFPVGFIHQHLPLHHLEHGQVDGVDGQHAHGQVEQRLVPAGRRHGAHARHQRPRHADHHVPSSRDDVGAEAQEVHVRAELGDEEEDPHHQLDGPAPDVHETPQHVERGAHPAGRRLPVGRCCRRPYQAR